jgi:hypothetical protein
MALRLALKIIKFGIFEQFDQTYWVLSFAAQIQSFGRRPREMQAGVPLGSVLSPTLVSLNINDAPQTHGVHLALFADDTYLNATDRKEGFIVRKLQRGLSAMETWCEP